jgi:hypothetical protein
MQIGNFLGIWENGFLDGSRIDGSGRVGLMPLYWCRFRTCDGGGSLVSGTEANDHHVTATFFLSKEKR